MIIGDQIKLILGSSSPRRSEILRMSGLEFEQRKYPFREEPPALDPIDVPEFLARDKSIQVNDLQDDEVLLTADTLVSLDGRIIGKPGDKAEAYTILERLSGRTHEVITGVALRRSENLKSFRTKTEVSFDTISPNEIKEYIERFNPLDKAGAYGIQEGIGLTHIGRINGCFFNVMGLPMRDLFRALKEF